MNKLVQMTIPEHTAVELEERLSELRTVHNAEVMRVGDDLNKLGPLARRGRRLTTTHLIRALITLGLRAKAKPKVVLEILAADPLVRGRKEVPLESLERDDG